MFPYYSLTRAEGVVRTVEVSDQRAGGAARRQAETSLLFRTHIEAYCLVPADENPVGACVANYVSKNMVVRNANVQEMRIGVSSPFFYGQPSESNGEEGQSLLRTTTSETYLGFSVASRTPTTIKAVLR
jgi:hypothetical protein